MMVHVDHGQSPEYIAFAALAERHDAILFDAYGVLVNAAGALPGAAEAVSHLIARDQPFLVVTNDASRSPERASARGVGIASVIVLTGVTTALHVAEAGAHGPTYVMNGLTW